MFHLETESTQFSAGLTNQVVKGIVNSHSHSPFQWNGNRLMHHCHFVDVQFCYCRPQFLAMYFNQPDNAGHRYGPDSEEVGILDNCCYVSED